MVMKNKIAYSVFTITNSGLGYMVKGNFGDDKGKADTWAENHITDVSKDAQTLLSESPKYPNGLFVKEIKY